MKQVTYRGSATIVVMHASGDALNFGPGDTHTLDDATAAGFMKRADFTVADVTAAPWPPRWDNPVPDAPIAPDPDVTPTSEEGDV